MLFIFRIRIVAGPCGPQFIDAFRCFLDSKEEEKGSNCIESFQTMQLCFHEHPEHYKDFLSDGEKETDEESAKSAAEQEAESKAAKSNSDWYLYNFAK